MIEFKYDDKGVLQAYRDGKLVGPIITIGEGVRENGSENRKRQK